MSFESRLRADMAASGFGSQQYFLTFKDYMRLKRNHVSKAKLDVKGATLFNEIGGFGEALYKDDGYYGVKYVAQVGMTYDMMLSIYEVSTHSLFACRFFDWPGMEAHCAAFLSKFRDPKNRHFEARIIGMQNGQDASVLVRIMDFLKANGIILNEVDLFGTDVRHIAIDAKTGMSYNVLLEDRLNKPGELANKTTMEEFVAALKAGRPKQQVQTERAAESPAAPR